MTRSSVAGLHQHHRAQVRKALLWDLTCGGGLGGLGRPHWASGHIIAAATSADSWGPTSHPLGLHVTSRHVGWGIYFTRSEAVCTSEQLRLHLRARQPGWHWAIGIFSSVIILWDQRLICGLALLDTLHCAVQDWVLFGIFVSMPVSNVGLYLLFSCSLAWSLIICLCCHLISDNSNI